MCGKFPLETHVTSLIVSETVKKRVKSEFPKRLSEFVKSHYQISSSTLISPEMTKIAIKQVVVEEALYEQ